MTKRIDPDVVRGVQAKFDTAFVNFGSALGDTVQDESLENLTTCLNSFKDTAVQVSDTITNFNDYLDTVATAFEQTDNSIASQISNFSISDNTKGRYRDRN